MKITIEEFIKSPVELVNKISNKKLTEFIMLFADNYYNNTNPNIDINDEVFDKLRWTYYRDDSYVHESLSTSGNAGSGKANTEIAMAKDSGTYVTADSNRASTIWYRLQQVRSDKGTGCDDWFVPSIDELELLRLSIKSGSVTGGTIAGSSYNKSIFNNKWLWSSSEFLSQRAWYWHHVHQCWDGGNKGLDSSVIFTRAF